MRLLGKAGEGLLFLALLAAWFFVVALLATVTGLRARMTGMGEGWVWVTTAALFIVLVPPALWAQRAILRRWRERR